MATSLGLKNASTSGSRELNPNSVYGTRKQFSDTYIVRAANKTENEEDVMNATGLPALRSVSSGAYLIRKDAREVDADALLWEVVCQYDSEVATSTPLPPNTNYSWGGEEITQLVRYDQVTGAPIVNSVNEPIPIEVPYPIPVLTIERLESYFNPALILQFHGSVNNQPFWGAPAGCALMHGPFATPEESSGVIKYRVVYTVKFNFIINPSTLAMEGWKAAVINRGTRYKSAAGSTSYLPFMNQGDPTTGMLNTDGTARSISLTPVVLTFNIYRPANFNSLQLGPWS
jgi:hypothetical protein